MRLILAWMALLVGMILGLGAGVLPAQEELSLPPDGTPIEDVRFTGLKALRGPDLLRAMELRPGEEFGADKYRRDLQTLSNTGKIDPLRLRVTWTLNEAGRLLIDVEVTENRTIRSVRVIGNVKYSEKEILSQLEYKAGDVLPTGVRASTLRNLNSFYRNAGYKSARVRVDVLDPEEAPDQSDILITIDEGVRIRIRGIRLEGNTHLNTFLVGQRIANGPGLLFFRNYFDESALDDDVAAIRTMYQDAGFLDAKVSFGAPDYDAEKAAVLLRFNVEEGPRYKVRDVGFEGVTYFTDPEVRRAADILPGRTFKGSRTRKVMDRLRTLYGNQGYIDSEVGYKLERDAEAKSVRVLFTVEESPVSYVGAIRLKKEDFDYDVEVTAFDRFMDWFAPPVKDETILKEVRLRTGEKYRTADEVRTVERLKNLGIFRKVEVERETTPDPSVKDAAIVAEEDPAAAFVGVTAGVGELSGPSVTFRFTQPNMGGVANRLSASATFGTRNQAYRLGYFDRYIGDSQTSADYNLYSVRDRYRAYRERTLGGAVEFGRPLNERLTGYLRFRLERVDYASYDRPLKEDFDGYEVVAARPMLVYDRRDNMQWPTRGYLVSGGFETGWADGYMLKFLHEYEYYHQFERTELVYAYGHKVGLMPYNATDIGLSERFFVGGSGNLRGFRFREVGPRDPLNERIATGGSTRLTQRHELRYPINDFLKARVFTDVAILERGPFSTGRPRVGSGAGVMMDLGPITVEVDLAAPVLKREKDRAQYFHLRIGSDF